MEKLFFFVKLYRSLEWLKWPLHYDISASYVIILPTWWEVLRVKQLNKSSWHVALLLYWFRSDVVTHHWKKKKSKQKIVRSYISQILWHKLAQVIELKANINHEDFYSGHCKHKRKKKQPYNFSQNAIIMIPTYISWLLNMFLIQIIIYREVMYIHSTICVGWLLASLKQ